MRLLFPLLLAFLITHASVAQGLEPYVEHDGPIIALRGVKIVDGTGAAAMDGQTILIRDGRIAEMGPSVTIPAGAEVLDLKGHTVLPGLVGMHNHTFYTTSLRSIQLNRSAPRLYLASGVTTIRTTGSMSPYAEINLKGAIDRGEVPGPRMFVTGPYITGGTGVSSMSRVSGAEDTRRLVSYWADEGVSWLKAYTEVSREELGAMIDEAHKHGVKVTAHLCSVSYREAVGLGIDNLEHGLFANTDFHPAKEPDKCPPDHYERLAELDIESADVQKTIDLMIDNGVGMTSTLAVYELFVPNRPAVEQRVLDAMSEEVRREYLDTRAAVEDPSNSRVFRFSGDLFKKAQRFEYKFAKSGGLLAAGVDPTGYGGALPGYGDQRNYELLLESGFTPLEAVQIMTLNGAKILGIEKDLGSIERGKVADLVVINGDPLTSPADIRNVTLVFKDGVGFNSSKLIESVAGSVGVN